MKQVKLHYALSFVVLLVVLFAINALEKPEQVKAKVSDQKPEQSFAKRSVANKKSQAVSQNDKRKAYKKAGVFLSKKRKLESKESAIDVTLLDDKIDLDSLQAVSDTDYAFIQGYTALENTYENSKLYPDAVLMYGHLIAQSSEGETNLVVHKETKRIGVITKVLKVKINKDGLEQMEALLRDKTFVYQLKNERIRNYYLKFENQSDLFSSYETVKSLPSLERIAIEVIDFSYSGR